MTSLKNVLYLGWLGKGNVGDDVLFELFKTMFYKYNQSKTTNVNIDPYPIIQNYHIDVSAYDLIVLGGGSLIHLEYWLKICERGMQENIPVVSWGTGFDYAYKPESYDSLIPPPYKQSWFLDLYEKFDYMSVRGPFTKKMLENLGVKRNIDEIGDPALIYESEIFEDRLNAKADKKHILVNWGTSYNNIFGKNELKLEQELVTVIQSLLTNGYKVTIYPIWIEDIPAVKRLSEKVNDDRCHVLTEVYEAKLLQKMINSAYLTINMKLHANILSASGNRPFISLAYRGKCFDFARSVDCLEYTVGTDIVTAEKILALVKDIEENYLNIIERFHVAKSSYTPKLIASIQTLSGVLNH